MTGRALLLVLVAAAALALPTRAQQRHDETLDRLLPSILATHPGQLVDAAIRTDRDGRSFYHIRWITPEGRILDFDVNATNENHSDG